MKFFVDTADVAEIRELAQAGMLDGVTTNPSLMAKAIAAKGGGDMKEIIADICAAVDGPVSAEVTAVDADLMIQEGHALARLASNVVVKLPITADGLKACAALSREGIATNLTLCFSAMQGLLAAKAGATFVSPFVGRLDDIGANGIELLEELRAIYDQYGLKTQVLAASLRNPDHVKAAALAGSDCATVPPAVLRQLVKHPLTDKGLEAFLSDWAKAAPTTAAEPVSA